MYGSGPGNSIFTTGITAPHQHFKGLIWTLTRCQSVFLLKNETFKMSVWCSNKIIAFLPPVLERNPLADGRALCRVLPVPSACEPSAAYIWACVRRPCGSPQRHPGKKSQSMQPYIARSTMIYPARWGPTTHLVSRSPDGS